MIRKITAYALILMLVFSQIVQAEEPVGTDGSFFGFTYMESYSYDNILKPVNLNYKMVTENGIVQVAQIVKTALDKMPEGRRCIDIYKLANEPFEQGTRNYFFPDEGARKTAEMISALFAELKKLDAKIDYIIDDFEAGYSAYQFENYAIAHYRDEGENIYASIEKNGHMYEEYIRKILMEFQADETYQDILKPMLEAAGFVFGKNYDLEYLNIHPQAFEPRRSMYADSNPPEGGEFCVSIFDEIIRQRFCDAYQESIYLPIAKYYPNVKFGQYGEFMTTSKFPLYNGWGIPVRYSETDADTIIGTHAAPVIYGIYKDIRTRVPKGYPYEIYKATAFNVFLIDHQMLQVDQIMRAKTATPIMPWVGIKSWYEYYKGGLFHNYDNTDYYQEVMFHLGMLNPDPYLIFDHGSVDGGEGRDVGLLSKIFKQLDEIAGFDDRSPIVPTPQTITKIDQRYFLSGMSAGGRNVWRITPDLYTPGVSIENFVAKTSPLTFQIGNQFVEFPENSYIYKPKETISDYGYWVISPQGTKPKEYRDNKLPEPDEPVETEDGKPTGHLLKAEGTGKKATVAQTSNQMAVISQNEEGTEESEDAKEPEIVEITTQKLAVTPLSLDGKKTPLSLKPLPSDINNHWAKGAIANLFALGIVKGSDAGFEPDREVNLAEFLAMIMNAFSVEVTEYSGGLEQLNKDFWAADLVYTALKGEWITEDDLSLIEIPLTRERMALVYYNACKELIKTTKPTLKFTDEYRISQSAKEAISALGQAGIIDGFPDGEFKPKETLTRAQAAVLIETFFVNNRGTK